MWHFEMLLGNRNKFYGVIHGVISNDHEFRDICFGHEFLDVSYLELIPGGIYFDLISST